MCQITLRLPIKETHSHKEILGFESLDDDYPPEEHKELKRSDSHLITMPTQRSFAKNHRQNVTNDDDDSSDIEPTRGVSSQIVVTQYENHRSHPIQHQRQQQQHQQQIVTNNERSNGGSTYDKVLLTPQDQYIPTLPKVIISASASVTDASGKKLNYSVGNVIPSNIKLPPLTYDEYREDDVSLDPFFIDVPKIAPRRGKRNAIDFIRTTAIVNNSVKN